MKGYIGQAECFEAADEELKKNLLRVVEVSVTKVGRIVPRLVRQLAIL